MCSYCDRPNCGCNPKPNRVLRYALETISADAFVASLRGTDLWRYEALLPVGRTSAGPLPVGGTPLIELDGALDGARVYGKDETRHPSGSLKDRATEVALAVAASQGHSEVIAASTGNAGASLACIAAARGMRAIVVVPASAPRSKLSQIGAFGADLVAVDGSYDDAFDHALERAAQHGTFCRNTGVNPYTREGKKTAAFEIAEQLGWRAPDWVVVPCGDGNVLAGIGAGFEQLEAIGCTARSPRLVAAQAASSNSIELTLAQAVRDEAVPREPVAVAPRTRAESIAVSRPRDHVSAVRALLRSDGIAASAGEDDIRAARSTLARRFGLWVEPSSAVAYAVARRLRAAATIAAGETVVILLTGAGLKDPEP